MTLDEDLKGWIVFGIFILLCGLGLGSCTMMEDYGEAAKIAAACKAKQ